MEISQPSSSAEPRAPIPTATAAEQARQSRSKPADTSSMTPDVASVQVLAAAAHNENIAEEAFEERERKAHLSGALDDWEILAMHALSRDEASVPSPANSAPSSLSPSHSPAYPCHPVYHIC